MIQKDKLITISSHRRDKKYYLSKGYKEENGKFLVSPIDLPRYSAEEEERICDICKEPFFKKT